MSPDLTGPSTAVPPEPFALLAPDDRRRLPEGVVDACPLTEAQASALARLLTAPAPVTGNRIAVRHHLLDRPFAPADLRHALDAQTAAHDTLRTSFAVLEYGAPLQLVHAAASIPLTVHDLRGLDERRRQGAYTAHESVERQAPLPSAPPLRLAAQLETDTRLRLVLTYSPALLDAQGADDLLAAVVAAHDHGDTAQGRPCAAHVAAERALLADQRQREHWRRVTDACAPLLLPDGWGTRDHTGGRRTFTVPFGDLAPGLRTLADRTGASLGTLLLAAHLRVLESLTPESSFHTAVLGAGRGPQARLLLGAHRTVVAFPHHRAVRTWRRLVADTQRSAEDIEPYRRYPWAAVRRAARPPGRFADVLFDPAPAPGPDLDGTEYPLVVRVHDEELVLDAVPGALDETHGTLLAGIYRAVLSAMTEDPDGDAAAHRLPGRLAREVLTAGAGRRPGRNVPLLPELVAARAAEQADATAVVAGDTTLDYGTLDARANRVAHRLRERGVGPGDLVGVLLGRGPELLPALLGVLGAGAAYVPLDPSVPAERLDHILTVADAPLILTETALVARIPAPHTERAVALDAPEETAALARQPAGPPAPLHGPDDLAYVIFTSGSTGTPKGVMIGHGALAGLLHSFAGLRGNWLAATSVSFDISGLELYLPLTTGGRVILADDTQAKDPAALLRLVDRHRVTHVQATPSGWRLLLAAGFDRPGVTALAGGEELPARLAADLRTRTGDLTNVYGPTETTIWSASWQVPHGSTGVALGEALPGESLHILDQALQPVPPGVPGELCIGGAGLARGYHGRPALTAERFVPDPYGVPGARLYRTGDLARRHADGTVEFLGRIDTQVKISGHRIELGEIRAALTAHPAIRDAVVTVRETDPGTKRLVAYVVMAGRADVSALRRHLAGKLPAYMIPAAFVAIPRIPLSVSGKVDHRALPAPGSGARPAGRTTDPVQARVAALCADVLGLRGLGPDDDFLQHGAPSLPLVRLLARIRGEYRIDLPASVLFARPTISGLAEAIRAAAGPRPDSDTGPIPTEGNTAVREYSS